MERAGKKEAVILVREETSPEDIHGMHRGESHRYRAWRHDFARGGGCARQWAGHASRARANCASMRRINRSRCAGGALPRAT